MDYRTLNDYSLCDFYTSSWQRGDSALPLLIVRLLLAALAVGIFTWSVYDARASPYWLLYLTSWGVLLAAVTTTCGVIISFIFINRKTDTSVLPWYITVYWVIFNITVTMSVTISALFWLLLYTPGIREAVGTRLFLLNLSTHVFTPSVVMADLLISRIPIILAHIYQPLLFGLSYALFTYIYYVAGGTDLLGNPFIYDILNWQHPKRSGILVVCSVVILIFLYFSVWCLALLRDKLSIAFALREQ